MHKWKAEMIRSSFVTILLVLSKTFAEFSAMKMTLTSTFPQPNW
jgi:hypothetical protein